MANLPTPRSKEFKSWQLDKMPIDASWTLNSADVERLNERTIRVHVSVINRVHQMNLKSHKNEDKSLTIWHDPTPRVVKPLNPLFQELLDTQQRYNVLKAEIQFKHSQEPSINASEELRLFGEAEDKINSILAALRQRQETWTRKNHGGRVAQPLGVILNRLGITREIWDLQTPNEKVRRWIAEEVKIKQEQLAQVNVTAITVPKID